MVGIGNDGPPRPSSEITWRGCISAGSKSTSRTARSVRPPGCWFPAIGMLADAAMSTACPYDVRRDDAGPRVHAMAGEEARHRHRLVRLGEIADQHEHAHVDPPGLDVLAAAGVDQDALVVEETLREPSFGFADPSRASATPTDR